MCGMTHRKWQLWGKQLTSTQVPHSNNVTSSKRADTLICHTTMRRNPINFLYNLCHVTLWYVEVCLVANAREHKYMQIVQEMFLHVYRQSLYKSLCWIFGSFKFWKYEFHQKFKVWYSFFHNGISLTSKPSYWTHSTDFVFCYC